MAQKTVSLLQPLGTPGQRVNLNPLNIVAAPNDGFRAGAKGLAIGAFAWPDPDDSSGRTLLNSGTGSPLGFLHKNRTGVIVQWLARAVDGILPGQETVLYNGGDFFAIVGGASAVKANTQVYADPKTGAACSNTTSSAVPTNFTFTSPGNPGDIVSISGYGTVALQSGSTAAAASPSAPSSSSSKGAADSPSEPTSSPSSSSGKNTSDNQSGTSPSASSSSSSKGS